ncbi:pyridoxamine 5'-phosphate oxidase family protein [Streptomyces sp. NPDC001787]|uniref:pyridoxamine 5'-phosphate oxidase family protein n=1 Tax=Streptomyces sp. NPDC001787 TaxID=3154523 RepID=UPI0033277683
MAVMTSNPPAPWAVFAAEQPDYADIVRKRFQLYKHHVLATLRKDGSPRVTGLEAEFRLGELWLGMMPGSRKAQDLLRDPRFALQANPGPDAEMNDGDVRVAGRAVAVTDPGTLARFAEAVRPPEPFLLFRAELTEAVRTTLDGETLVVRTWRPGQALRTIRRGGDDPQAGA